MRMGYTMTRKLNISETDKDLTPEDKRKLKLGRQYFETDAINRFMFGDVFLFFNSTEQEEVRRKKNPYIEIGPNTFIKSGTVIGGDGFNFNKNDENNYIHREHNFKVIIGSNVNIGNNCTIDRGCTRDTQIQDGTKIDNQVNIGHDAIIGKDCLIHAHVTIGSGVNIGDGCEIYPFVNISGRARICDGVRIGGHTLIRHDIELPGNYLGIDTKEVRKIE